MVKIRKLKPHEQKLVKKVDFMFWKSDGLPNRETKNAILATINKYLLKDTNEYTKYNKIVREINSTLSEIYALDDKEFGDFKQEQLDIIHNKLYQMGVIDSKTKRVERIRVGDLCSRRLSYLMYKLNFAESVKLATMYISHGHVRVGPEIVTDPAYLVTRNLEDFITWVDQSKIRKTILKFNNQYDDYFAENC